MTAGEKRPADDAAASAAATPDQPSLSVILPVYNAMPWLPIAVRDMLKQDLGPEGTRLELICCDDGSTDGSLAFLEALAALLGAQARREVVPAPDAHKKAKTEPGAASSRSNPALEQELRAPEAADHPSFAGQEPPESMKAIMANPLSAEDVLRAARPEHELVVLSWEGGANRGQGAAMSACLAAARAPLVAQMESDDEREREDAFRVMLRKLREEPDLDAVGCMLKTIGWERKGMDRYVKWQNSLTEPDRVARERFIEQPLLHQTALFRRSCVDAVVPGGVYRDGRGEGDALDVPVDYYFWLSFFHLGKRLGKVKEELFGWRQHPRQHTRTHGRLSVEALRKMKVHFLLREGGPARGHPVQVLSVGRTLEEWGADLRAHPDAPPSVETVAWKPGQPVPKRLHEGTVRLFAFGLEKAREKVRQQVKDWDAEVDWFVA